VKVLLQVAMLERGTKNGELFLSDRMGAQLTWLSRNTVWRGLRELQDKGFIYCSVPGGFSRKTAHAACFGLTWAPGPKGSQWRAPSHAYESWQPNGNTRFQLLTATGPVSDQTMETRHLAGADMGPDELEKRLISVIPSRSDIGPHTSNQGLGSEGLETDQRKQANLISSAVSNLRSALLDHLQANGPGEQSRLADRLGIPGGTLSKFIGGRNLPEQYRGTLAAALRIKEAA
jgi:hypothetical protein